MKMKMKNATKATASTARGRHRSVAFALIYFLFSLAPLQSFAHQQKTAVTRILFNANTGNIEVMHRFFIHDAEHAVNVVSGEPQNLMESAVSRELFSNYVMNRFAVATEDELGASTELDLHYVGEEIDGQFLWVYQEAMQRPNVKALSVINLALRDVWPDQANLVNVEKDGEIHSISFSDSIESLRIEF